MNACITYLALEIEGSMLMVNSYIDVLLLHGLNGELLYLVERYKVSQFGELGYLHHFVDTRELYRIQIV